MAKGTVVKKTGIKRKKGHLYFVDANGDIRETKMARGRKRTVKRKKAVKRRKK